MDAAGYFREKWSMTPPSDELAQQNGVVIRTHDLTKRFDDDVVVDRVTNSVK